MYVCMHVCINRRPDLISGPELILGPHLTVGPIPILWCDLILGPHLILRPTMFLFIATFVQSVGALFSKL